MSFKILLLGSGGREHALGWKISQSSLVEHVFVCPGNGGTSTQAKMSNLDMQISDFPPLVKWAVENQIGLVVVGPDQLVVDGVEGFFRKVGIPVFGPTALAARMEGSKAFSKAFMESHHIPTAKFKIFKNTEFDQATEYVNSCGHSVVLKASGLAAGKGVLLPQTVEDAISGLRDIMVSKIFGNAGNEVVIEELLTGPEISVLAFCDGYTIVPLPAAQDHKRIGEGDIGLNTGGMGAYAPAPVATADVMKQIMDVILRPTIDGMRKDGFPFVGMLFTGLMLTETGPKVLEYNVRFGDPETQALMLLLHEDTDLAAVLLACAEHRLDSVPVKMKPGFAVSIVLVSEGYPGKYPVGKIIKMGSISNEVMVFHAGTALSPGGLVTAGGRVLAVTAYSLTIESALAKAYANVEHVEFEGKVFRRDIAHRALSCKQESMTYAAAGVSVDAGNALVEAIKPIVRRTRRTGADGEIGGFGGVFDLKATGYKDPVLVSGTDGVGTKLRVAVDAGIHDLVGIDLVAMSVNDLIVQGAEPLYFLDYYGCSKLDVTVATEVIKGIAEGCCQAGCALIGGETAEMPGMYAPGDYDLAGFAVGAVERHMILPRTDIKVGDILLGLASSGLHSNGFSLARKIISKAGLNYSSPCPWEPKLSLGRALLEPTRIYTRQILPVAQAGLIKAMSHITGGGFIENIPRVLPKNVGCIVDAAAWQRPPVFTFLQREGCVEAHEMARTFNNGIGMVLIVGPEDVETVVTHLTVLGPATVHRMGEITGTPGVAIHNLSSWATE